MTLLAPLLLAFGAQSLPAAAPADTDLAAAAARQAEQSLGSGAQVHRDAAGRIHLIRFGRRGARAHWTVAGDGTLSKR